MVDVHLKSKNPPGGDEVADGDNRDCGDGPGYWNGDRTRAANELIDWLSSDPTGSRRSDYLILGDMNSYRNGSIMALKRAGYVNQISSLLSNSSLSYVFPG